MPNWRSVALTMAQEAASGNEYLAQKPANYLMSKTIRKPTLLKRFFTIKRFKGLRTGSQQVFLEKPPLYNFVPH